MWYVEDIFWTFALALEINIFGAAQLTRPLITMVHGQMSKAYT